LRYPEHQASGICFNSKKIWPAALRIAGAFSIYGARYKTGGSMAEIALIREFLGKQGYVKVKFLKTQDPETGRERISVKGHRRGYRFGGETFDDLYEAQRWVADRIVEIDKKSGF
jgi:hypothetical protein